MVNTKISFAPEFLTGGGVSPYESPSCEVIRINVSGPLCQSLEGDSGSIPGLGGEEWPTA